MLQERRDHRVAQASSLLVEGADVKREPGAAVGRVIRIRTSGTRDFSPENHQSRLLVGSRSDAFPGDDSSHVVRNVADLTCHRIRSANDFRRPRSGEVDSERRRDRVRGDARLGATKRSDRVLLTRVSRGRVVVRQRVSGAGQARLRRSRDGRAQVDHFDPLKGGCVIKGTSRPKRSS